MKRNWSMWRNYLPEKVNFVLVNICILLLYNVPSLFPSSYLLHSLTLPYGGLFIAGWIVIWTFMIPNWETGEGVHSEKFSIWDSVLNSSAMCEGSIMGEKRWLLRRIVDSDGWEKYRTNLSHFEFLFPWRLRTMWDVLLKGFKQLR